MYIVYYIEFTFSEKSISANLEELIESSSEIFTEKCEFPHPLKTLQALKIEDSMSEFEDATEEELLKRMQEMTDINWNNQHVPDEAVLGSVGEYMLPNLQSMGCGVGDINILDINGNLGNLQLLKVYNLH